ncbi:MAG: hypothetical protein OXD42_03325 [Rhodospirillaceae bacterium]|nr:hypothetical protein [Rhodospirillaceae bacterium]
MTTVQSRPPVDRVPCRGRVAGACGFAFLQREFWHRTLEPVLDFAGCGDELLGLVAAPIADQFVPLERRKQIDMAGNPLDQGRQIGQFCLGADACRVVCGVEICRPCIDGGPLGAWRDRTMTNRV